MPQNLGELDIYAACRERGPLSYGCHRCFPLRDTLPKEPSGVVSSESPPPGVLCFAVFQLKNEDFQCVTKKEAKDTYLLPEVRKHQRAPPLSPPPHGPISNRKAGDGADTGLGFRGWAFLQTPATMPNRGGGNRSSGCRVTPSQYLPPPSRYLPCASVTCFLARVLWPFSSLSNVTTRATPAGQRSGSSTKFVVYCCD